MSVKSLKSLLIKNRQMLPENYAPTISLLPDHDLLNIALLPVDPNINQLFYEAVASFRGRDAGYCLNPENALPHVTLCQFQHESPTEASKIVSPYLNKTIELSLDRIYLSRYPIPNHLLAFWIGISTSRNPEIISLQSEIAEKIAACGCDPKTPLSHRYHPHFSLLLLDPEEFSQTDLFFSLFKNLLGRKIVCTTRLGASDQIGQYQRIIAANQ
jgi:2'-5' RNA ligase